MRAAYGVGDRNVRSEEAKKSKLKPEEGLLYCKPAVVPDGV